MRTRVWRIAMFSLFIFGLGCVGCATKRPTSTPSIPPPTRFADESAVYVAAPATSVLICIPRPITPSEFVATVDLTDVAIHTSCSLLATPTSVAPTDTI